VRIRENACYPGFPARRCEGIKRPVQDPFRTLFQTLVNSRIALEAHYEQRDEAIRSGTTEAWQAELNLRWDRWAECEQRVRERLSAGPEEPEPPEELPTKGWRPFSDEVNLQFAM
jgi:hypothetical protein